MMGKLGAWWGYVWNMRIQCLSLGGGESSSCVLGLSRTISAWWERRAISSSTQLGLLSRAVSRDELVPASASNNPAFTYPNISSKICPESADVTLPHPEPFVAVPSFRELSLTWHWALHSSLHHLSICMCSLISWLCWALLGAGMMPYPQLLPKSQFSSGHILVLGGVVTVPADWHQQTFAQHRWGTELWAGLWWYKGACTLFSLY